MSLGPFAKLTVIDCAGFVRLAHTAKIPPAGRFRWYDATSHSESVGVEDEGVRWIRGYHDPVESEAVVAMRAAQAMSASRT